MKAAKPAASLGFMPTFSRIAAMVVLVAVLPAASASAETLSVEPQAPKVSALDGIAAWSIFDQGAWYLVARRNGVLERLPVATRSVPFDVDVGTDASDRYVATYSRCRRDPVFVPPQGRGCDLYAYDFFSRTERLLRGPSTEAASEYMPSLAGGRIAFGRVRDGRTDVYVGSRRVPGGTRNGDERTGPTGLDLSATHLAIAWRTFGPVGLPFPYGTAELRVNDLQTGTQTIVVRLANSNLDTGSVVTPALVGRWVRYGMTWVSEGDTVIGAEQTYDLRQGMRTSLPFPDRLAGVAESGSGETYFVRCDPDGGPCEVAVIGTPPGGTDPDVDLTRLERPSPLAWSGRWVAYSAYDRAARVYRLTLRSSEGRVLRPDVRPRRVPFDANLGRGPRDELTAVYSRCRVEPRRGCAVYRYDTRSGRERKVPGASGFLPAVDGSRIVFARRTGRGRTVLATPNGELATLRGRARASRPGGRPRAALAGAARRPRRPHAHGGGGGQPQRHAPPARGRLQRRRAELGWLPRARARPAGRDPAGPRYRRAAHLRAARRGYRLRPLDRASQCVGAPRGRLRPRRLGRLDAVGRADAAAAAPLAGPACAGTRARCWRSPSSAAAARRRRRPARSAGS
jgi:hypothetical protein